MIMERLDWDHLRVFRVVAELGSMNAAAKRLGESSPTVARKIADLEDVLKTPLLTRSTRGVEPTEAGKIVLREVGYMAAAVDKVVEEAGNHDPDVEGRIVLATGDGLGPYWIAPRLPKLQARNPKMQLRLRVVESAPDLLAGDADISIQFAEPKSPELIGRKLGTLHYMSFASKNYPTPSRPLPNSHFDYYKHRCILHEGYVNQVERWAPRVSELKKMIDFALVTNAAAAIIEVCANDGGIAVLPSYIGAVDKRLVPLDLPEIAPIQFWLTYTERVRRLPAGQVVLDWITSIFDRNEFVWFRDEFIHPSQVEQVLRADKDARAS